MAIVILNEAIAGLSDPLLLRLATPLRAKAARTGTPGRASAQLKDLWFPMHLDDLRTADPSTPDGSPSLGMTNPNAMNDPRQDPLTLECCSTV